MALRDEIRRVLATAWFAASILACGSACAQSANANTDEWIAQLDSGQYQVREQATQQLLATGTTALDALTGAANGGNPEPADRAVWILQQLSETDDLAVRQQVLEHLARVDKQPQVAAAAREELAQIKHDAAVQAILRLGGRLMEPQLDPMMQQANFMQVTLDDKWRGGDEGLKYIKDLRNLVIVTIIGSDISRAGLEQLQGVDSLRYLHLYRTRIEQPEVEDLKKLLPGVEIDYRLGALLGIRGGELPPVRVLSVQPGTAAAGVDIRQGDVIQKFNDKPVADFKQLTGEIAKHRPGDEVTLDLQRGTEALQIKVKLGRWEAIQ
jgi:PDZ domain